MWTHIRVWILRVRGHTGRSFLQRYVKRTSGAVSTLTTEGRSSSLRDSSSAILCFPQEQDPHASAFDAKFAVSFAQRALHTNEADEADPVWVRSTKITSWLPRKVHPYGFGEKHLPV